MWVGAIKGRGYVLKGLISWACVFGLLVLIVGCGGGGGGSSTGSTGGTGTTSGTVHATQVTGYIGNSSGPMQDTRNVYVGETVQLELTARDTNNNLVVLPAGSWSTTAPKTVATVTSAGVLTGIASSEGKVYTVSSSYKGTRYTSNLIVSPQQDLVSGTVQDTSTTAIGSAIVDFYNASGTKVASAYTTRDGSFLASVPATSVSFTLDLSLADPDSAYYYHEFAYGTNTYLDGTSCLVSLPTPLSTTGPTALPSDIVVYLQTLGPPPPPTGCLQ